MKRLLVVSVICCACISGLSPADAAVRWTANNHWYEPILVSGGLSWQEAQDAATLSGGYLATITSQEEHDFVYGLVSDPTYWNGTCGPWLGGYQPEGSPEPAGGWTWVTGEPWSYTRWWPDNQPDNSGGNEDCLDFEGGPNQSWYPGGWWNDRDGTSEVPIAYVVEWEHYYEAVMAPGGISWQEAQEAATLSGGYLATITSQEEHDFVYGLVSDPTYWNGTCGPWLGGYQPEGSPEPAGGWTWVTGEPWSYTRWWPDNQPDNSGGNEDCLDFEGGPNQSWYPGGWWNDRDGTSVAPIAYVVEWGFGGAPPTADIVIWEPDPSPLSGPVIASILDGLGLSYVYTTTSPDLAAYEAAFICLGVYSQNYVLSTVQANALVSYIDGGGKVYMEGGDCWAYDSARTIYNGRFGIDGTADGAGDLTTVLGQAETFTAGMDFPYSGGNSWIDHIAPIGAAYTIFKNPADGAGCGVANPTATYKTVGCSFEFGGLVDGSAPSTKAGLLGEILDFLEIGSTGVPSECPVQLELSQNSPNPFNPITTLAFETSAAGRVELAVYSASGRRVAMLVDGVLPAGPHASSWRGTDDSGVPVASGVYFFRLSQGGQSVSVKGVMLK